MLLNKKEGFDSGEKGAPMQIGGREFCTTGHTYVCGILNITPDSFSDGGQLWNTGSVNRSDNASRPGRAFSEVLDVDALLRKAERMIAQGAELLDIGGESTRPGAAFITAEEELRRVIPAIEALKRHFDVPLSLDTRRAEVARAGLEAGVDLINDVSGLKGDADMAGTIARAGVPCCLMHSRPEADYQDLLAEVVADLNESVGIALAAGIGREQILLDPGIGIGFGKTYEQNLTLIGNLDRLLETGFPVLLGCSRKSVIGQALKLPVEEREEGTLVTTVMAVLQGAMFVRVHNVEMNVRAVRMAEAILRG